MDVMIRPAGSPHLRRPAQDRSHQTLERLLRAAEETLRQRSWGQATLSEIAHRAGVTTGAFYARFADKDALLRHLEEASYEALGARVEAALRPLARGERFEERLEALYRTLADHYAEHRGIARALSEESRSDAELGKRRRQRNTAVFARGRRWVMESHAKARAAGEERVTLALLAAVTTLREQVLFRDLLPDGGVPRGAALCRELAVATAAYLNRAG
jgi:AcrR family transcriptional regulator